MLSFLPILIEQFCWREASHHLGLSFCFDVWQRVLRLLPHISFDLRIIHFHIGFHHHILINHYIAIHITIGPEDVILLEAWLVAFLEIPLRYGPR